VAAYFNPIGFRRRLANYRVFRRNLPIPLVTVELAHSASRFELRPEDADILIQVTGEDCLWQKERLLNLALAGLPSGCDRVAWLDCDLVLPGSRWEHAVNTALDDLPLAQAFSRFHELGPEASASALSPTLAVGSGRAVACRLASGDPIEEVFASGLGNRLRRGHSVGLAWAARRELLDQHRFYDACIVGGGDKAMVCAALGRYEYMASLEANERQMEHYFRWARPFFADVAGRIGYAEAEVYHLWHGELRLRRHRDRHRQFRRFAFDPFVDIALDTRGAWRWNSDKPEMHAYVKDYLASRREDG
jgi:hypothetical protein